ncbi:hypothetical protein [Cellulosimicrobium sp. NPDC057127]|uniref:hypothetical protein n=1 Tax=Cellulosimicrobium sp. NPDC057127 TaxID=3346026 RepID=UPI0036431CA2
MIATGATAEPRDVAAAALAARYLAFVRASAGTRAERLAAEVSADVVNEVSRRVLGEPDPFPTLDALVTLAHELSLQGDDELLDSVGAGPVEDAIVERADLRPAIAERCRRSVPGWRETVRGAWVDAHVAATLPPPLDGLVTGLRDGDGDARERSTGTSRRRSKRQELARGGRRR